MRKGAFILITDGKRVLMHLRRKDRLLGLPGGLVEDGESPLLAAKRELQEEYGISCSEANLEFVNEVLFEERGIILYLYSYRVSEEEFDKLALIAIRNFNSKEILGVTVLYSRIIPEIWHLLHKGLQRQLSKLLQKS